MSEHPVTARWRAVRAARRAALIPFVTAGYPSRAGCVDALHMVVDEGADFVELGIPFSDPLADGPVIERATHAAIAGGMTVTRALETAQTANLPVPVIAFSYLNPILAYGFDRFLEDAWQAGISALLLTDLPAGAHPGWEDAVHHSPLHLIRLVAPTTPPDRMIRIAAHAQGFLYVIARLGITGAATALGTSIEHTVATLRQSGDLPIAVGFGIQRGEQVRALASIADGVVVGTALVERLGQSVAAGRDLMRELRSALDAAAAA